MKMRVSIKYGFTFLCMPKCASTSIEKVLTPYSELIMKNNSILKSHLQIQYSNQANILTL